MVVPVDPGGAVFGDAVDDVARFLALLLGLPLGRVLAVLVVGEVNVLEDD